MTQVLLSVRVAADDAALGHSDHDLLGDRELTLADEHRDDPPPRTELLDAELVSAVEVVHPVDVVDSVDEEFHATCPSLKGQISFVTTDLEIKGPVGVFRRIEMIQAKSTTITH